MQLEALTTLEACLDRLEARNVDSLANNHLDAGMGFLSRPELVVSVYYDRKKNKYTLNHGGKQGVFDSKLEVYNALGDIFGGRAGRITYS